MLARPSLVGVFGYFPCIMQVLQCMQYVRCPRWRGRRREEKDFP